MDQLLQALASMSRLLAARDAALLLELHAGLLDLAMGGWGGWEPIGVAH
jgi:hypothetical protein